MGPCLRQIPFKVDRRTRANLKARGMAEFKQVGWILLGRLTALGVEIRDRWHTKEAEAMDRQLRRQRQLEGLD
jgi:hypothetical protein